VVGDNQQVAKEIGMEDYLLKTDDPQIIGERVKQILIKNETAPTSETPPPQA
jgi:hypothetical protein